MTNQNIEKAIQEKGLTAPRITFEHIEETIKKVDYHVFPGTQLTVCCLTLANDFTVTGESACASPENFDEDMGKEISYGNAFEKVWMLEGYLLKEKLHEENTDEQSYVEYIAKAAHEVNAAYCLAMDDYSQTSWASAPQWQRDSALKGVRFHMDNPDAEASHSHESWYAEKEADGWVYGEVKDPEKKTHPCMVSFEQLPAAQQAKDFLFRQVVHSLM